MTQTFYAMSAENAAMSGWTVLAVESTRAAAQAAGEQHDNLRGGDIRADTWRKNLVVLSDSAARKRGFIPRRASVAAHDGGFHFEF